MRRKRLAFVAAGFAVSAVFLYLALRGLDLDAVVAVFARADLLPWIPLGIALYLCSHVARGVRCRLLVRRQARLSLATATHVVVVGYAANNVLPARLGELVRSGMLTERAGIPLVQSITITFIERVFDGIVMLFMLVVATLTVEVAGWMSELVYVALAVFGIASTVVFAAAHAPGPLAVLAERVSRPLGTTLQAAVLRLTKHVTNASASLRNPLDAARLFASSFVVWGFEAGMYIALLPIFGIPATWQLGVTVMCVTSFGLLVPSSPGAIGPYHYFASQTLIVFGVTPATALAYATLVHLTFYIPVTLWGAVAMIWFGVKLKAPEAPDRVPSPSDPDRAPKPTA